MILRKLEKAYREKDYDELKKLEEEMTRYLQEENPRRERDTQHSCSERIGRSYGYDADLYERCRRALHAIKEEINKRESERGME